MHVIVAEYYSQLMQVAYKKVKRLELFQPLSQAPSSSSLRCSINSLWYGSAHNCRVIFIQDIKVAVDTTATATIVIILCED